MRPPTVPNACNAPSTVSLAPAPNFPPIEFFDDERVVLYDLGKDIGETLDLSGEMPEKRDELLRMLHDWRESVGAPMMSPNPLYRLPADFELNVRAMP